MKNFYSLVLCSCIIGAVYGRSEADIKASFMKLGMECNTEFPVSSEEIQAMRDHKIPDTENAKCLLACVYKKLSWRVLQKDICLRQKDKLDDQGNFDVQSAKDHSDKEHPDDQAKLEGSKKLFDLCKKVNDEKVSDGAKGCERATHLSRCLMDNAAKYGFKISK